MDDRLLRACRRERVFPTPVWFMRQAGRVLPGYRRLRERYAFVEILREPDLATEVTLMPVRELGVDGAILFADLATPLTGTGVQYHIEDRRGLIILTPLRTWPSPTPLRVPSPEESVPYVLETVRRCRAHLNVPLIGFVGAPFTLATYLLEGKTSRDFRRTRLWMYQNPNAWHGLMDWLTEVLVAYARGLVRAGVQIVQVFDSWVGVLSPSAYVSMVAPYTRRLIEAIRAESVPVIHFGTGAAGFLDRFRDAGGDIIGVDWRIPIDQAWEIVGPSVGIQGNLDPAVLMADWPTVQAAARDILERVSGRPGHIFNLGHGVLPQTELDRLKALVDFVHAYTS